MKMKRGLSLLLVLIMVLSMLPGGVLNSIRASAAEANVTPLTLKIDFKDFATKASKQPWWENLGAGSNDMTKYAGSTVYNKAMTVDQQQAYKDLLAWQEENFGWHIDESVSKFLVAGNAKVLHFNSDPNVPWGLCYRSMFHGMDRCNLVLNLTVPEGGAGLYSMNMDIFRETTSYVSPIVGAAPGGGYLDIYVNEELAFDEYYFGGPNTTASENLGMVQLNEGTNTIRLYSSRGFTGTTSNNERCVYDMSAITFDRLTGLEVENSQKAVFNLRNSYLPYNADMGSYTLAMVNDSVAKASIDSDGNVVVQGLKEGQTMLIVQKGSATAAEIPVYVTPKLSLGYDFSKASSLTTNGFDAIEDFEDLNVDDVVSDPWCHESGSAYWSAENAAAILEEGTVSFTLDVTKSGWFETTMDLFTQAQGGAAKVWLDELYLGTMQTKSTSKSFTTCKLRPVQLQEGTYTLTLEAEAGTQLWWTTLRLKQASEPVLALGAEAISGKQDRTLSSKITAQWNTGMTDDLTGATWSLDYPTNAMMAWMEGSELKVIGKVPGEHIVEVTGEVFGVEGTVAVPVTVIARSPLVSAQVSMPTVVQNQIARNTTHDFVYTLTSEDGDTMTAAEVDIAYKLDAEGIVDLDEVNHCITGLENGTVNITVTISADGITEEKTFTITVANVGGNLMDTAAYNFEADAWSNENWIWDQPWNSSTLDDAGKRFVNTDVIEEENGNHALRFRFNPDSTYNTKTAGAKLQTTNGNFIKLEPGRMYEASVRVRTKDLTPAPGTGFLILYQSYDYPSNKTGTVLQEIYDSVSIPQQQEQWTRITVPVRAPIDYTDSFYYMSCFVIRPSSYIYHDTYGFSGDIYVDDIELREVGFDRVEMSIDQTLTNNRTTATVYAEPYTTNDQVIALDADRFDLVEVENSNPDVVAIESDLVMKASTSGENVPSMTVRLTGLNGEAQLSSAITIHGVTQTGTLDMSQSTLADEMLYAYYTLNDAEGVTLSVGNTAEGKLTGLTTQNIYKTEEELRTTGSVYFKSSDEAVVTVDQETGDVTAVGEGTATVTAYANFGGFVKKDEVTVVVTDDTDLASVSVTYTRDYIGTNQQAGMIVSGAKASGVVADMSLYPVTWTVDNAELAEVDENGRLTAKAEGTVIVTATANVDGKEVAGSFTMTIIDNTDLPGETYEYVLHHGQNLVLLEGSLEEDGIALNKELTEVSTGMQWNSAHGLTVAPFYPGHQVALDFILPKSGWYTLHNIGTSFSWGGLVDVFLDDMYMGQSDYAKDFSSYGTGPALNTVYLEAGKHTLLMINVRSGYMWCGGFMLKAADDFGTPDPILKTKQTLLVGETTEIFPDFTETNGAAFYLKSVAENEAEGYTNYYSLLSSSSKIISIENGIITAKAPGKATVTMIAEIGHEMVFKSVDITVLQGSVLSAELSAERTTLKPDAEPVQLTLTGYGVDGEEVGVSADLITYESKNTAIATVDENGLVTITGQEGSAEIVATITDGENVVTANIWITVTKGKTEPTLYTWEEREIVRENVLKYDWAWETKEGVLPMADFIVENLDWYYDRITHEGIKRNGRIGSQNDPEVTVCYNCKTELAASYNHYPWEIDPINDPWKIKCPLCDARFPSNDFASFYECGLDEQGRFSKERALANGGEKYLVNELYPEMGPDYGVDDGDGWVTGRYFSNGVKEVRYFVAYYHLAQYWPLGEVGSEYAMLNAMENLRDAYLYTGDERYAIAGTILLDRFADVYPDFNYFQNSISRDRGKIVDMIWEGLGYQQMFATCADIFWPVMDHPDVVKYLQKRHVKKGIENPEDITPEYIRDHIDNNLLLQIKWAVENGQSKGNAGMTEAAMAYAAVALDRLPESAEMIDWVFRSGSFAILNSGTGEAEWTGGSVMDTMVQRVNRDGLGDEGSIAYNRMWYQNFMKIADALSGYERVEGADLWKNSKFLDMFIAMNKVTVLGNSVVTTGETGYMQASAYYPQSSYLLQMFVNTSPDQVAHVQAAQILYAANNHSVEGLHGDIYTKDPEDGVRSQIQQIVNEHGEWNASESDMLCGEGLAILRNGPDRLEKDINDDQFSDYWMFFGLNGAAHGAWEALNLGIDAYGLSFTGGTGYPVVVNSGSAPREHFMRATLSHNTVTVNEKSQLNIEKNSFPMHFDDAGKVKVIDAEAAQAYRETEIYRRTLVTVELENEEYYAVDFFRVLGGKDHVYSFHVHGQEVNETEGLNLIHQPMGTYAGADVPLGIWSPNPYVGDTASNREPYGSNTAASWMDNVYRDSEPSGNFTVDFAIEDFHGRLITTSGLGLRLTMLSDEPLTEVAIADGHPDQNGYNPEYVKYLLVNRNYDRNDLNSMFTSVIEPYQYEHKIEGSELVSMTLVDGTEELTDESSAIKVTRKDGQVDYIVYATNNTCTYRIDDLFDFRGFVGVCSYVDGGLTYAYGNDAVQVADVIEDTLPAITGEVVSFTEGIEQTYSMTIRVDQPVTEADFDGRYIYVNNDREENGAYRIYGAEVNGDLVVLDLFTQSIARRFVDGTNMDLGYVYNIEAGQTFTIPLSNVYDALEHFNYTRDQVIKAGGKLNVTCGVAGSGVTYEADGLVSGMRLDAKTGQLTWTTSKTNTGRFPVTIKAVRDGEVVGELSFVVYVVAYTGSTYAPDICSHSKAETFEADGMIETVCPSCGTITKEEKQTEKINIAGANMSLGNELKLNVMVRSADLGDGIYTAKITHGDAVTEEQFTQLNSTYHYVSTTVSAKQMADVITVQVMDENGNVVSDPYETSVRDYAMKALASTTTKAEMKTLAVDMLNYGSEAQIYFKYNTEDLANSLLTEAQKALATGTVPCENRQVKGTNFHGSNLSLEDRIILNLFFRNCKADMYAEVSFTDYKGREKTVTKSLLQHSDILYRVAVDEIVLSDAFSDVTVTVYNADGTVHGTATDAVESYCARAGENALNTAIMKFAYSARQYLG